MMFKAGRGERVHVCGTETFFFCFFFFQQTDYHIMAVISKKDLFVLCVCVCSFSEYICLINKNKNNIHDNTKKQEQEGL